MNRIQMPLLNTFISFVSAFLMVFPVLYLLRRWLDGGKCHSKARLDGKTVIITGANTGIGKETAIDLARRGARVIMGCRSSTRGSSALTEVKKESGSYNVFMELIDLASLKSIREFVRRFREGYRELHVLINNAGVLCDYAKTEDGFEINFGINHLGHFALTNLLLPCMVSNEGARIVNVSSREHFNGDIDFDDIDAEKNFDVYGAYAQSKLANVIFTKELARKLDGSNISTYSLHPGVVRTEIGRHTKLVQIITYIFGHLVMKSPSQGAQTTIYCAVNEDLEMYSGRYFSDCTPIKSSRMSYDEGVAKKLWELSELRTGVSFPQM